MSKAAIAKMIEHLHSVDVSEVLNLAYLHHYHDHDWRVYEWVKRELQMACEGNPELYENSINILTEILGL